LHGPSDDEKKKIERADGDHRIETQTTKREKKKKGIKRETISRWVRVKEPPAAAELDPEGPTRLKGEKTRREKKKRFKVN